MLNCVNRTAIRSTWIKLRMYRVCMYVFLGNCIFFRHVWINLMLELTIIQQKKDNKTEIPKVIMVLGNKMDMSPRAQHRSGSVVASDFYIVHRIDRQDHNNWISLFLSVNLMQISWVFLRHTVSHGSFNFLLVTEPTLCYNYKHHQTTLFRTVWKHFTRRNSHR